MTEYRIVEKIYRNAYHEDKKYEIQSKRKFFKWEWWGSIFSFDREDYLEFDKLETAKKELDFLIGNKKRKEIIPVYQVNVSDKEVDSILEL